MPTGNRIILEARRLHNNSLFRYSVSPTRTDYYEPIFTNPHTRFWFIILYHSVKK